MSLTYQLKTYKMLSWGYKCRDRERRGNQRGWEAGFLQLTGRCAPSGTDVSLWPQLSVEPSRVDRRCVALCCPSLPLHTHASYLLHKSESLWAADKNWCLLFSRAEGTLQWQTELVYCVKDQINQVVLNELLQASLKVWLHLLFTHRLCLH